MKFRFYSSFLQCRGYGREKLSETCESLLLCIRTSSIFQTTSICTYVHIGVGRKERENSTLADALSARYHVSLEQWLSTLGSDHPAPAMAKCDHCKSTTYRFCGDWISSYSYEQCNEKILCWVAYQRCLIRFTVSDLSVPLSQRLSNGRGPGRRPVWSMENDSTDVAKLAAKQYCFGLVQRSSIN